MSLIIEVYRNKERIGRVNSQFGHNVQDNLGNLIGEIQGLMAQLLIFDFQVEVRHDDGDSVVVWRTDTQYTDDFFGGDLLIEGRHRVLPPLDSQELVGIVRVHTPIPSSDDEATSSEDNVDAQIQTRIGMAFGQSELIGDFTEEQKDFVRRVIPVSFSDEIFGLDKESLVSTLKILTKAVNTDGLETKTEQELAAQLMLILRGTAIQFEKLPTDLRLAILPFLDNKTLGNVCGSSHDMVEWCVREKVFDMIFRQRHGPNEYKAFISRHPHNELYDGLWRLRTYEYVKSLQLFEPKFEFNDTSANGFKAEFWEEFAEGSEMLQMRFMANPNPSVNNLSTFNERVNEMIELAKRSGLSTPHTFIYKVGENRRRIERVRRGKIRGDVASMERFIFSMFKWGVDIPDGVVIMHRSTDNPTLNINCNACGGRSMFRCKRCKSAHYCSKKCHQKHKHKC